MANNEKATIREVVDMLKPLQGDISNIKTNMEVMKTLFTEHLKHYDLFCEQNRQEHKVIMDTLPKKISIKAFISWLGAALTVLTIILSLLGVFRIL